MLGKCHKGLGQRAASVRAYTTALNLDPKVKKDPCCVPRIDNTNEYDQAAQYIKEAMESLDDSDDDDMDDD